MNRHYNKKIILEDGTEFYGYGFGADRETTAEVVFTPKSATPIPHRAPPLPPPPPRPLRPPTAWCWRSSPKTSLKF